MGITIEARVCPAGQDIEIECKDASGNPTNVTAVASIDDVQTMTITGVPGNVVLTFDGQTTGVIAGTMNAPGQYALFTIPVIAGHSLSLACNYLGRGSFGASVVNYQTLDSDQATQLAISNQSGQASPSGFADGVDGLGGTLFWNTITSSNITPLGSTIFVRISATNDGGCYLSAIRVNDTTASTITKYSDGSGAFTLTSSGGSVTGAPTYLGTATQLYPTTGAGPVWQVSGGATALLADFNALSSVQPLSLSISGTSPYTFKFSGAMGGTLQPVITCPDGAVSIVHTNPGGNVPDFSVDNGSTWVPITVLPAWSRTPATYQPFLYYPLPQSLQGILYGIAGSGGCFRSVQNNMETTLQSNNPAVPNTISGQPFSVVLDGSLHEAGFRFQRLPPGTYQWAFTYLANPSNCTHACVQLRDGNNTPLSGQTNFYDLTVAPSGLTDNGSLYTIGGSYTIPPGDTNITLTIAMTSTGSTGTGSILTLDGGRLTRTSSDLSVQFTSGQTVMVRMPANYATTVAGAVPAQTVTAVNSMASGSMLPAPIETTPMATGFNIEAEGFLAIYTNLAHRITTPFQPLSGSISISDANGYPTQMTPDGTNGVRYVLVVSPAGTPNLTFQGLPGTPNGKYAIVWDGDGVNPADHLYFHSIYPVTAYTEDTTYAHYTGTTDNIRVFNIQSHPLLQTSPEIYLSLISSGTPDINGHLPVSLKNLRIYPPDPSDPTGMTPWGVTSNGTSGSLGTTPPKYHPNFFAQIGNAKALRWLDPLNTNNGPVADFGDYCQVSALSRNALAIRSSTVASITPVPDGMDPYFSTRRWSVVLVTTTGNHGVYDGAGDVQLWNCGTGTFSDGSTVVFGVTNGHYQAQEVKVIDATHFLMAVQLGGFNDGLNNFRTMTNSLTGGSCQVSLGTTIPLQDIVEICNGAPGQGGDGVVRDLWWNTSAAATDACDNSVADYIAANLNTDSKVHLELANEIWNFSWKQFYVYCTLAYRLAVAAGQVSSVTLHESPSTTLKIAVAAGTYLTDDGNSNVVYAGTASFTLSASTTNYVWLTTSGVLTKGSAFPGGLAFVKMAIVKTNGSSIVNLVVCPGNSDANPAPGQVSESVRKHAIYRAAFVSAGRPATDVRRMIATNGGNLGVTNGVVAAIVAANAQTLFDEFPTSNYFDNQLYGDGNYTNRANADSGLRYAPYDTMTVGQAHGHWQTLARGGSWYDSMVLPHRAVLEANGCHYDFVIYEGSLQVPTPGLTGVEGDIYSAMILRHPFTYHLAFHHLQAMSDRGVKLAMQFNRGSAIPRESNGYEDAWPAYIGWSQGNGTGSPSENTNPWNYATLLSQQGGAINDFGALYQASPPPPPTGVVAMLPTRYGTHKLANLVLSLSQYNAYLGGSAPSGWAKFWSDFLFDGSPSSINGQILAAKGMGCNGVRIIGNGGSGSWVSWSGQYTLNQYLARNATVAAYCRSLGMAYYLALGGQNEYQGYQAAPGGNGTTTGFGAITAWAGAVAGYMSRFDNVICVDPCQEAFGVYLSGMEALGATTITPAQVVTLMTAIRSAVKAAAPNLPMTFSWYGLPGTNTFSGLDPFVQCALQSDYIDMHIYYAVTSGQVPTALAAQSSCNAKQMIVGEHGFDQSHTSSQINAQLDSIQANVINGSYSNGMTPVGGAVWAVGSDGTPGTSANYALTNSDGTLNAVGTHYGSFAAAPWAPLQLQRSS